MSHRASLLGRGYADAHLDSPRVRFRRALLLCAMTVVAPGSAQVAVGNRWVGRIALAIWVALIGGAGYLLWKFRTDRATVLGYATDTDVLMGARIAMIAGAVLWIALFVDAWRLATPLRLRVPEALLITVLNTAIVLAALGSTAFASHVMAESRGVVKQVFVAETTSPPLKGRYNILLVGSDSGKGRTGIRPDSLNVASIDSTTGRVVLVSLPRNLQNVPFPDESPMHELYPYGFNCGSECLLNAVHTAAEGRSDLYPDSEDPGLDATIDAVEGVTGLPINYYVMINMKGMRSLVDAVGGVTIDVKTRIAMFGHDDAWKNVYIEPGVQELNGQEALWYARSRVQSDDYTRMGRQKCLMSAMLHELSPQTVLTNVADIAASSKELLSTSIPAEELGPFADLALKAKGQKISTVSLVPPEVNVAAPDFEAIKQLIADAIEKSEKGSAPSGAKSSEPAQTQTTQASPDPGGTANEDQTPQKANQTDDLASVC